MPTVAEYNSPVMPTWCPGCGDFAIWSAIKQALVAEGFGPKDVLICFDIGCNGNMADKINAYVYKGLHGRVIPAAAGAKLANQGMPVLAIAGDGGTFDEGMQHFVHSIRSDYDITFIVHNNCDFGLTTGQPTPTTWEGQVMNSAPWGVVEKRLNPVKLALSLGASFVARGFTGNLPQLVSLIRSGITHKGFSYVDVLQHCPTYNHFQDHHWLSERVYDVATKEDYRNERDYAYSISEIADDGVATGILYQDKESQSYMQQLPYRKEYSSNLIDEVKGYDISASLAEFR
ncbi:MAG: 2-oxoglutarate oxidoreductase subunit KorB [candidate division WS6 bacterium OLB20]|uniref:2-oxoglutarate oxidoreductase subunit KorB n=1 Tax=candidate division WS6 bacterium OLB20 TaxID=1617426 RepID=A0A136LY14_9BACT|nr:MAG: 2-oxoglutarate oxidoreductase subunit KorB [candidate division WS6 bacterium OLB20]